MIPRRFKRKKNFVTNGRKNERKDGWTDRRVGRNSDLDEKYKRFEIEFATFCGAQVSKCHSYDDVICPAAKLALDK